MTAPSEQWIVSALRQATDRMPLPPESRWIRERRSTARVSTIAVVGAAAIFIVAVGITVGGGLRVDPRLVPGAVGTGTFEAREDAEWRVARAVARAALPSSLVLLRPAWIPAELGGSAECPSPLVSVTPGAGYQALYQGRVLSNGECATASAFMAVPTSTGWATTMWLAYGAQPGSGDHHSDPSSHPCGPLDPCGPMVEIGTFNERGTTVHVSRFVPGTDVAARRPDFQIHLWWNESGAHYDMLANDVELDDLLRVIRSLEPVQ